MNWKIRKTETARLGRFEIIKETVEKDGSEYPFSYAVMHDVSLVIPFTDENHVLIEKQYRRTMDEWMYEFPAGAVEENETCAQAAARELLEETGYEAEDLQELGWIYPSAGSTTERIFLYMCRCGKVQEPQTEGLEEVETLIRSTEEIEAMIRSGEFRQASGICAWHLYRSQK